MRVCLRLLVVLMALLVGGPALAQEPKGWLGADVQDVTKAEADKLGWDTPHGAKLGVVASGSPAEKVMLKAGDIILTIDGVEAETAADFEKTIAAKKPATEVRLRVLSGGRERRVAVTLAERPKPQAADASAMPHLMLDTGGHMSLIRGLAFTPDGTQLISAGDDKVIRVWDWQAGKTVRTIRGQVWPGSEGKIFAMALSPNGRWLVSGGWFNKTQEEDIRLYDFATGKLIGLLRGHTAVVNSVAFSPDERASFREVVWAI